MNFSERVKIAWAAFRQTGMAAALPPNGRSSDESLQGAISSYLSAFGSVSPVIDFQMLKALKYFYLYNPDVSQYVANIVNLGNPGHSLSATIRMDCCLVIQSQSSFIRNYEWTVQTSRIMCLTHQCLM